VVREYEVRASAWIRHALAEGVDFDFCISDFVPEAFELARLLGRPSGWNSCLGHHDRIHRPRDAHLLSAADTALNPGDASPRRP
jgi:hypothetical protein